MNVGIRKKTVRWWKTAGYESRRRTAQRKTQPNAATGCEKRGCSHPRSPSPHSRRSPLPGRWHDSRTRASRATPIGRLVRADWTRARERERQSRSQRRATSRDGDANETSNGRELLVSNAATSYLYRFAPIAGQQDALRAEIRVILTRGHSVFPPSPGQWLDFSRGGKK